MIFSNAFRAKRPAANRLAARCLSELSADVRFPMRSRSYSTTTRAHAE